MFFIILTFCAALFIEGLGSLVSVIGISALFGANPIIIALAIALDVGKVVTVSLLYTYWKSLGKLMKSYALLAAAVTMIITSAGAAGYLSGEFQKAIVGTKEGELKVAVLKEQQQKYQDRKKQIDDQIANLPAKTTVNQRLRLMNGFKAEQKALDEKIAQIDKDLPALQVQQIGTEAKAGPIIAIAKAFKVPVEEAVTWVIGMIIFVFDPLAIFLIIAGNFLLAKRREEKAKVVVEPVVEEEVAPVQASERYHPVTPLPEKPVAPEPEPIIEPVVEPPPPEPEPIVEPEPEPEPAPVVVEPEPAPPPEPLPEPEPEPEPQEDRRSHVPTGLLKPVVVEHNDEVQRASETFTPLTVVPKEDEPHREEITRSTLGLVPPDPNTVVNARRQPGFRKAKAIVTTPTKR